MIEQAALWSAQLATDEATQADREACESWCCEHPLHRIAMERMRAFDAQIDNTDKIGREAIQSILQGRTRKTQRFGGIVLGLAVLIGGGWLAAQSLTVRAIFPDYQTARGDQRTVKLADGSALTVDTDATLDFDRGRSQRTVTLFRGQVLVRVARDPDRLFVIRTEDGTATALGTAFAVRKEEDSTTITVLESHVRACAAGTDEDRCTELWPGDSVRLSQNGVARLDRVDPETAGLWAEGWLVADDQSVADVLHELNRYREKPVRFTPSDLAGARVSGSFPLSDPDRALDGIVHSTGLRLSHADDGSPVVSSAK
jgi:transmembrane sensor